MYADVKHCSQKQQFLSTKSFPQTGFERKLHQKEKTLLAVKKLMPAN